MYKRQPLYAAGALIFVGFGAKAGLWPMHIWLPTAHPVAPAPASAVLSGVITKCGVFGVAMVTVTLFAGVLPWGLLLLAASCVSMVLGAVLAVFSTDLKRTFACSSVSQIGFVPVSYTHLGDPHTPSNNGVAQRYVRDGVAETGALNAVAGMILDYRAFDTFGESTVLFAATMSVLFLLQSRPEKHRLRVYRDQPSDRLLQGAVRIIFPFILLFGIYVVLNGHLSPGAVSYTHLKLEPGQGGPDSGHAPPGGN